MTSQAVVLRGLRSTHLVMERRHPLGLVETEECWAQRADAVQTQKAAAEPHRTVGAWAWPPASPGKVESPQSQGFQFLEHCCQRIRTKGHLCGLGFGPSALSSCPTSLFPPTPGLGSLPQQEGRRQSQREKAMGHTVPPALSLGHLTATLPYGLTICPGPC